MNKITVNLSKDDIFKIISEYINNNLPGFETEELRYNIYEKLDIRNQPMGLDIKGIDVVISKANY